MFEWILEIESGNLCFKFSLIFQSKKQKKATDVKATCVFRVYICLEWTDFFLLREYKTKISVCFNSPPRQRDGDNNTIICIYFFGIFSSKSFTLNLFSLINKKRVVFFFQRKKEEKKDDCNDSPSHFVWTMEIFR